MHAFVLSALLAVVAAPHAMVVTEQRLASQAGLDVLRAGGNAVDAAVAVGYALAVVDPCCGNIGGGGFMLIRMHDGRERFIDFREKAPLRATRDMYLDTQGNVVPNRSRKGWLAIGVPGTVMGMERARTEFGTMSRATLLAPAIHLARNGYVLVLGDLVPFSGAFSELNVRSIWMPDGKMPRAHRASEFGQLTASDFRRRYGRLLSRLNRARHRRGEQRERRHSRDARFRRLHGRRILAVAV
jgi:gamma-glutamyltranspeptidase